MERSFDAAQINLLRKQYHMERYFDTQDLPFLICRFQPGELICQPGEIACYLHFVLEGNFSIYSIRDDGSKYTLAQGSGFALLGDLEFAHETVQSFYAEAADGVVCLSLPIAECRSGLKQDNRFLNCIIENLTQKMYAIAHEDSAALPLKERILNHMRYHCKDGTLQGIENASHMLHCSSRQLQRLLNALCQDGQVCKVGKGAYRLLSVANFS